MRRFAGGATVLLACALLTLRAQPRPSAQQSQPPPFRAGVDIVQLDVSVLDSARRPVKGLTAADFTVLENGAPREIVAFEAVDIPLVPEPAAGWTREIAPDVTVNGATPRRVVVIVLDDAYIPADAGKYAQQIARDVVRHMGPDDVGAVTVTNYGRRQDLTADRQKLLSAIDAFVPHGSPTPAAAIGLQASRGGPRGGGPVGGIGCGFRGPYRTAAACVLDTLLTAADALREAPPGRKTLVYVSAGPPLDFQADDELGNSAFDVMTAIQQLLRSLQEANVNVYAIDPTGLTAEGIIGPRLDALRVFAEQTGGRAVFATNAPESAVPQIYRENSSYYLLGIRSSVAGRAGFRRIQVKVNRPEAEVRARSGYYAGPPLRPARKAVPPVTPLDKAIGLPMPGGALQFGVALAPFKVPGKREAAVAVVAGLRQMPAPAGETVDLLAMALDADCGDCRKLPSARQTIRVQQASADTPAEAASRLDLRPGRYEIRVAAASGSATGNVIAHVDVPDFEKERLSASGLVFFTPGETPFALFRDVLNVRPTTRREFRGPSPIAVLLRLYQAAGRAPGPVRVETTIRDEGDRVAFTRTTFVDSTSFNATRSYDATFELPLPTLNAGEHLLTIEAHLGTAAVRREARFTVR